MPRSSPHAFDATSVSRALPGPIISKGISFDTLASNHTRAHFVEMHSRDVTAYGTTTPTVHSAAIDRYRIPTRRVDGGMLANCAYR